MVLDNLLPTAHGSATAGRTPAGTGSSAATSPTPSRHGAAGRHRRGLPPGRGGRARASTRRTRPPYAWHNDYGTAVLLAAMYAAGHPAAGAGVARWSSTARAATRAPSTASCAPAPRRHSDVDAGRFEPRCPVLRRPAEPGSWCPRTRRSTPAARTPRRSSRRSTWPARGPGRPAARVGAALPQRLRPADAPEHAVRRGGVAVPLGAGARRGADRARGRPAAARLRPRRTTSRGPTSLRSRTAGAAGRRSRRSTSAPASPTRSATWPPNWPAPAAARRRRWSAAPARPTCGTWSPTRPARRELLGFTARSASPRASPTSPRRSCATRSDGNASRRRSNSFVSCSGSRWATTRSTHWPTGLIRLPTPFFPGLDPAEHPEVLDQDGTVHVPIRRVPRPRAGPDDPGRRRVRPAGDGLPRRNDTRGRRSGTADGRRRRPPRGAGQGGRAARRRRHRLRQRTCTPTTWAGWPRRAPRRSPAPGSSTGPRIGSRWSRRLRHDELEPDRAATRCALAERRGDQATPSRWPRHQRAHAATRSPGTTCCDVEADGRRLILLVDVIHQPRCSCVTAGHASPTTIRGGGPPQRRWLDEAVRSHAVDQRPRSFPGHAVSAARPGAGSPGGLGHRQRQPDLEAAAGAVVVHADLPAVRLHQPLRDGQAEPAAAGRPAALRRAGLRPAERHVEDPADLVLGDAAAGVVDREQRVRRRRRRSAPRPCRPAGCAGSRWTPGCARSGPAPGRCRDHRPGLRVGQHAHPLPLRHRGLRGDRVADDVPQRHRGHGQLAARPR